MFIASSKQFRIPKNLLNTFIYDQYLLQENGNVPYDFMFNETKKKDVKGHRHFWKCSTHSLIYENEACGSHLLPTTNKPEKCANLSTIWRIMNRTQREKQQARNYLIFKEFHLFCDIHCCLNWIIKWNKSHFWHERAIIIIKFLLSSSLSSRKVDYLSLLLIIISSMFQTINSKKLYEWINDRRASLNDE